MVVVVVGGGLIACLYMNVQIASQTLLLAFLWLLASAKASPIHIRFEIRGAVYVARGLVSRYQNGTPPRQGIVHDWPCVFGHGQFRRCFPDYLGEMSQLGLKGVEVKIVQADLLVPDEVKKGTFVVASYAPGQMVWQ